MTFPTQPKIYHILHVDRLPSIIADSHLWCDAEIIRREPPGTTIGMNHIKQRRLKLPLTSYPDLHVGDCVPFYFCARSIMLYLIHQGNHLDMTYHGGQSAIIHLEADLHSSAEWASKNEKRWAFTLSNAGGRDFEDRNNLIQLNEINWNAIWASQWSGDGISPSIKYHKQAEFLMEYCFPWNLIERIGVYSKTIGQQVMHALNMSIYRPQVEIMPAWYY